MAQNNPFDVDSFEIIDCDEDSVDIMSDSMIDECCNLLTSLAPEKKKEEKKPKKAIVINDERLKKIKNYVEAKTKRDILECRELEMSEMLDDVRNKYFEACDEHDDARDSLRNEFTNDELKRLGFDFN